MKNLLRTTLLLFLLAVLPGLGCSGEEAFFQGDNFAAGNGFDIGLSETILVDAIDNPITITTADVGDNTCVEINTDPECDEGMGTWSEITIDSKTNSPSPGETGSIDVTIAPDGEACICIRVVHKLEGNDSISNVRKLIVE